MPHRSGSRFALLVFLFAWLPALALAEIDPPARVGRLAIAENEVNFRVDRSDPGNPATVNWPISSGASLSTGRRGRAETWVGSTAYRLAENSRLEFSTIDDQRVDLNLEQGSLTVSILDRDQADDVTVYTPEGRIRFATPGRYRVDVRDDRTELGVQAGRASLDNRTQIRQLGAGQKASLFGDGQLTVNADYDQDSFDHWVAARENATLADTSRRHVSPAMTGYQDLDAYGDWRPAADYGTVWYPRTVDDDWAPYRFGRWAWVAPWGWTWIDQSPWGFAPFHYGRWVLIQGRWAWAPGSPTPRPVYAPALVGWIGNPGWSVGFSFGTAPAVGWFPLAPREVYVPPYRHSPTYVRQINVTHIHNVNIIERSRRPDYRPTFVHRDTARAVTVVPAGLVREGRTIGRPDIQRRTGESLGRAPQPRYAPDNSWLRPSSEATRPRHGERGTPPPNGRDTGRPARPEAGLAPRATPPVPPQLPERRQPTPPAERERPDADRQAGPGPRRSMTTDDNNPRQRGETSLPVTPSVGPMSPTSRRQADDGQRPSTPPDRRPASAPNEVERDSGHRPFAPPPARPAGGDNDTRGPVERRASPIAEQPAAPIQAERGGPASRPASPGTPPDRRPASAPNEVERDSGHRPFAPPPARPAGGDNDTRGPVERRASPIAEQPATPIQAERGWPASRPALPGTPPEQREPRLPRPDMEERAVQRQPPPRSEPLAPPRREMAAPPPVMPMPTRAPQSEAPPPREPRLAPQPEPRRSEPRRRERDDGDRSGR